MVGVAFVLVILLVAVVIVVRQENRLAVAVSRQLAAESAVGTNERDSELRALAAWRAAETVEARGRLLSSSTSAYAGTFPGSTGPQRVIAVDPTGHLVATGGEDGEVSVWRVDNRQRVAVHDLGAPVISVGFNADGSLLAASAGQETTIWQASSSDEVRRLPHAAGPLTFAGAALAVVDGGTIQLWNQDGTPGQALRGRSGIEALGASPRGDLVFARYSDAVRLWRQSEFGWREAGEYIQEVRGACASDDEVVTVITANSAIWRYDLKARTERIDLGKGGSIDIAACAGQATALGMPNGDIRTSTVLLRTPPVSALAIGPDGTVFAAGRDSGVDAWRPGAVSEALGLPSYRPIQVGGRNSLIAAAQAVKGTGVDLRRAGAQPQTLGVSNVTAVARDEVHDRFAVATNDELILGDRHERLPGIKTLAFSAGGDRLAIGLSDRAVIWDVRTWRAETTVDTDHRPVDEILFAPGETTVAAASGDTIFLWQQADRRQLTGHTDRVLAMDFSEDGRYLASAGKDTTVRVWDLSGSTPTVLRHSAAVVDIAFAGNTLATAVSGAPLVQLWEDGRHKATLARHKSPVRAIR
jgi:WD40 repeat protein